MNIVDKGAMNFYIRRSYIFFVKNRKIILAEKTCVGVEIGRHGINISILEGLVSHI